MLEFINVSKWFKTKCILNQSTLSFPTTGLVVIQGESGSGKSTILNMIAGIEPIDHGSIKKDSLCTYILSTYDFINEMTVVENIQLKPTKKIRKRVINLIRYLGIETLMDRKIHQCSDGQRQRIGIARALANEQNIILCDEPSEFLDRDNRELVIELLQYYAKDHLVIIASHDPDIIQLPNAYLYALGNGELKLIHDGAVAQPVKQHKKNRIDTKWILGKVIRNSRYMINILLILVMVGSFIMLGIYNQNLLNPTTRNALIIDDVFYYKLDDSTSFFIPNEQLIPSFNDVSVDGQIIRILPLPLPMDETNTIVINQNCSDHGIHVGDTIQLNYTINNNDTYLEYTVDRIEEESDIVGCQIYYDMDTIINDLNQDKYMDYNNEEITAWQIMQTKLGLKLYQAPLSYDQIINYYDQAQAEEIEVFQPLFTQRYTFDQQAQVYRFIFWFTFALFIAFVCFASIHLILREFKSIIKALSIIIVFGANCIHVKTRYLWSKCIDILVVLTITLIISFALYRFGLTINADLIKIDAFMIIVIITSVALTDLICCLRLRQKHISKYFKNS